MVTLNPIFNPFSIARYSNPVPGNHGVQKREPDIGSQSGAQSRGIVQQAGATSGGASLSFGGPSLALTDFMSMAQTLFRRVSEKGADASLHPDDPDLTLKKLILARLMNKGRLPEIRGSIEMRPSMSSFSPAQDLQDITAESASYLSLDIRIELKDLSAMQGRARVSEDSIAIHLEYLSYSAISVGGYSGHGLNLLAPNLVDTGRYLIGFKNEMTVEIYEKFSRLSTVIWGDPHVDLSDVDGAVNGEFSDLKRSDLFTVFELQDGTKLLFTAPDSGLIQSVDILKNRELLHAVGGGAQGSTQPPGVFFRSKDVDGLAAILKQADWVKAGGDGNDWYGLDGGLVWGDGLHA